MLDIDDTAAAPLYQGTYDKPVHAGLRILATTDLHAHIASHDYCTDEASPRWGLVQTASLIAQARAEARRGGVDSILLDNGDFLTGSPLGDHLIRGGQLEDTFQTHPMISAMNQLGYDAVNLGNHEFSMGIERLEQALARARFPHLSANTRRADGIMPSPLPQLQPWVILDRLLPGHDGMAHRCRIGVIGVLPEETAIWDRQSIGGRVEILPMLDAVRDQLPEMRRAGADLIVLLAHCGLGEGVLNGESDHEAGALDMAALAGIDAVVMGHIHLTFPGPARRHPAVDAQRGLLHGKPAVMPGFYGSHLGVIDLDLVHDRKGWKVKGKSVALRAISKRLSDGSVAPLTTPDPELSALIAPAHRAARLWARRPIGTCTTPLHSYFSLVTETAPLQLVNRTQTDHIRRRLAGSRYAHLPVLSATAPFKAGGRGGPENFTSIPAGNLMLRHAVDLYGFPNTVMALKIDGAGLREWLERSVRGYCQIIPGLADQTLLDPTAAPFLFDSISGITYEIDLSAAPRALGGSRIHDLRHNGMPVQDRQEFIVATNSFRGAGSGGIVPLERTEVILAEPVANRDVMIDWLRESPDPFHPVPPNWRFMPMGNTSVIFQTSPSAIYCLKDMGHLQLKPLGLDADGFLLLRLTL